MLKNIKQRIQRGCGQVGRCNFILGARDKLTKVTTPNSIPAGKSWHTEVDHWMRVSRESIHNDVGRMERNHRDSDPEAGRAHDRRQRRCREAT